MLSLCAAIHKKLLLRIHSGESGKEGAEPVIFRVHASGDRSVILSTDGAGLPVCTARLPGVRA